MIQSNAADLYDSTAHLLRRAAFGAPPGMVKSAAVDGLEATTARLLNYESTPDNIDDNALMQKMLDALPDYSKEQAGQDVPLQLVKLWWAYRLIASSRPLQEKMVLFWHNHFTSRDGAVQGDFMMRQNQLYRTHALGNFRELTLAVARDPEMLRYLNGNQNFKAHPNENFARELMELFTSGRVDPTGQPNYTEDDVKAGARAFSGWNLRGGSFNYNPDQHDDSVKTFLGHTGNLNGDDVIDILVSSPSTASFLCHKLFRYFAYDDPEPEVMQALIATYYGSGFDIRAVVGVILRSQAFYSDKARFALIKSPADFAIGTIKMSDLAPVFTPPVDQISIQNDTQTDLTGVTVRQAIVESLRRISSRGGLGRLAFVVNGLKLMGQDLLEPPSVKGWDGGQDWINTDTLQARAKFAATVSSLPVLPYEQWFSDPAADPSASTLAAQVEPDPKLVVDNLLYQFGPLKPLDTTRQLLVEYATSQQAPQQRIRGTLSLILGSPDYQVC